MARMAGPSGLMLFATFDQGAVASLSGGQIRCRQYLVGNPAIAARIVRIEVSASLYVPFHVGGFLSFPGAYPLYDTQYDRDAYRRVALC